MVKEHDTLTLEIDTPRNSNVRLRALSKTLRGRFVWMRCAKGTGAFTYMGAKRLTDIPGQRLEFNPSAKKATIVEPLHESEHKTLADAITKAGFTLPPERQGVSVLDPDALLWNLKGAVDSGFAKLLSGTFPPNLTPPAAAKRGDVAEVEKLRNELAELRLAIADLKKAKAE
jgi:hypothetical protein